jgi:hypothetical protein
VRFLAKPWVRASPTRLEVLTRYSPSYVSEEEEKEQGIWGNGG